LSSAVGMRTGEEGGTGDGLALLVRLRVLKLRRAQEALLIPFLRPETSEFGELDLERLGGVAQRPKSSKVLLRLGCLLRRGDVSHRRLSVASFRNDLIPLNPFLIVPSLRARVSVVTLLTTPSVALELLPMLPLPLFRCQSLVLLQRLEDLGCDALDSIGLVLAGTVLLTKTLPLRLDIGRVESEDGLLRMRHSLTSGFGGGVYVNDVDISVAMVDDDL
jgi:hypothetical protein